MNPTPVASASSPTSPTTTSSWFSGFVRGRSMNATSPPPATSALLSLSETLSGRKKQLKGTLFKYGSKSAQVAFKTGDFTQQVVFIGGLTDGLLATDYLEPLSIALENNKWSLVQPLFSSSYTGYGTSSLKQDIVHYMRTNFACSKAVRGAILQAPVSDREYGATQPETAEMIDLATSLINEGKGNELMPIKANPCAPISAYRYHSLYGYMGDDDMFSSDLSEDQLRQRLGHMASTPCQVIFSMADEYVPEYVDKKALVDRLCRAMGGAEKVEIEYGNHSLSNRVQEAVTAIVEFLKREGPKGWDDPWS